MFDLVKLLNEFKNGYLSMCIRLLNLFEVEKGGGGYSVVFFGLFCWGFFLFLYVVFYIKFIVVFVDRRDKFVCIYKLKIIDFI